jgi:hypothetical protein
MIRDDIEDMFAEASELGSHTQAYADLRIVHRKVDLYLAHDPRERDAEDWLANHDAPAIAEAKRAKHAAESAARHASNAPARTAKADAKREERAKTAPERASKRLARRAAAERAYRTRRDPEVRRAYERARYATNTAARQNKIDKAAARRRSV